MKNAQSTPKLGNAEILGTPYAARTDRNILLARGCLIGRLRQCYLRSGAENSDKPAFLPTGRNVQNRDI